MIASPRRAAPAHAGGRSWARAGRLGREVLLTVGALLGLLCILATLAHVAFGIKPLVFRSGSMSPTITTGSLALAKHVDVDEVHVGDIVSVPVKDTRVTHRVQSITHDGPRTSLVLKGDANSVADEAPYTVTSVDRVFAHVPKVGYAVAWTAGPAGALIAGIVVTLVVLTLVRPPSPAERPRHGGARRRASSRRRRRGTIVGAVIALLAVGGTAVPVVRMTSAYYTDMATVLTGTVSAGRIAAPTVTCSGLSIGSMTASWTAVSGATSYVVHYGTNGATTTTQTATSFTISGLATTGTLWIEAQRAFPSTTWTSAISNKKSYSVLLFALSTCSDA